jgi:hypothetical protein
MAEYKNIILVALRDFEFSYGLGTHSRHGGIKVWQFQTADLTATIARWSGGKSMKRWKAIALVAGLLSSCGRAVADPTAQGPAARGGNADAANGACPSADFAGFLHAFSQRAALQKRYTHFPLEFGLEDLSHLNDADEGYKKSTVYSFEKIPNYDPDSGTVFPTQTRIEKYGLKIEIITIKNSKTSKDKNVFPEEIIDNPASVTAEVTLPDSGVLVFYRFRKVKGCWFLYAISDRST